MKIKILFIFLPILSQQLLSQDRKDFLSVNLGLSNPSADFAKKTFGYHAGFAMTGSNIAIDYYRYTSKNFALNVSIGYMNFKFNDDRYKNEYYNILNKSNGVKVDAGNYQIFKSQLGLVLKTPNIYNFELLIRAQLGYSITFHPKIRVVDNEFGVINSIEKSHGYSYFNSMGAIINYYFSKKYGISFSYVRNSSNPLFEEKTSYEKHFYLPVNFQDFNLGFIICL